VTGAAGFIGSHLAKQLVAEGWRVVGMDSFEDYYPRPYKRRNIAGLLESEAFTLLESNLLALREPDSPAARLLRDCVREADVMFQLAAQAGVRSSWGTDFPAHA